MQDLNDLYYFAMVVEHGGFAAAERALGIPTSRLSRRITQLEADMGVRLLQRSTRRFAVTDVGNSVYRHAQSMLEEAQAAQEVVERLSAEPRGVVRVSVPVSLAQQQMPALLPDLIQELLVASPKYLDGMGRPTNPSQLDDHVTMTMGEDEARQRWELQAEGGETVRVDLKPRVAGFDFPMLMALARQGVGITMLPESLCAAAVRAGELEVVLPAWRLPQGICHAVFASRRGMLPAVRVFIDYLAERLPPLLEASRLDCAGCPPRPGIGVKQARSDINH